MPETLTIQIAKQIAQSEFEKIEDKENRDFLIGHTKAVVETALILSEEKNVDKNALEIACWLHDIGQVIERKDHAQHSLEILEREGFNLNPIIADCILNHGNKGNPLTDEGKIIKIADKVSTLHPEIIKTLKKYTLNKNIEEKLKDLEFIREMANLGIDLLK
jgi:putative nucleotidyltransferase with HDIG domain